MPDPKTDEVVAAFQEAMNLVAYFRKRNIPPSKAGLVLSALIAIIHHDDPRALAKWFELTRMVCSNVGLIVVEGDGNPQ